MFWNLGAELEGTMSQYTLRIEPVVNQASSLRCLCKLHRVSLLPWWLSSWITVSNWWVWVSVYKWFCGFAMYLPVASKGIIWDITCISIKKMFRGAPGWLSQLSGWLRLRSWSRGPWVRAPRRALCWQLRDWSLFQILCLLLSDPPPFMLCLSLSQKNK